MNKDGLKEIERRTADPAAILARLKAQWQAEALKEVVPPEQAAKLRTMEMNDNCPWRNRLDELIYQLAETIPNLNEPDYYKNELIDRLNELRRQAEGEE